MKKLNFQHLKDPYFFDENHGFVMVLGALGMGGFLFGALLRGLLALLCFSGDLLFWAILK